MATVWSRRSRRDAANGAPVGGESTDAVDEMVDESVPDETDADALSAESEPSARTAATANTDGTIRKFLPPLPFGAWLARPMTSFHLMISVATLLTILGLIMVLSASGVHSYDEDGSPWSIFIRQLMWAGIGIFACWVALRLPVRFLRVTAFPAFATTMVLLVAVLIPGIGRVANGTRGWFSFAGLSMQPSELTKIAFLIWGSHILAARRMERASLREMLIPLLPAAVTALALIVAEPDLGQTVSLGIILLALLWFAGLPLKVFVSSLLAAVSAAAVLAVSAGYRSDRVRSWLDPSADAQGAGYQARQAKFALANGGVFAYTGMRIARRSADPFLRLLTATATAWVVGQVFINVGYVIGLLPVTGIQLPLISAGGTSTATTLFMVGLMTSAARHEPAAVASLRAGREDRMNRLLRLPLPEPYLPSRVEALRDRLRSRPAAPKSAPKSARPAAARPSAKSAKGSRSAPKRAESVARAGSAQRANAGMAQRANAGTAQRANAGMAQRARAGTSQPTRSSARAGTAQRSEAGTPQRTRGNAGHHGVASQQRRASAAQGLAGTTGSGRRQTNPARHSRSLEGQRYG